MSKRAVKPVIRLRGVRQHNLKNIDLDLPLGRLIVITGLSGSGKSSLAFDTLFAEGQRRYIETFSPYARQFFDRMDKPAADRIDGIPPAIAIEQRNAVKTTRSTVGTMTEICDYMKALWPHLAQLHCRQCGREVRKDPPQRVWEWVVAEAQDPGCELLITFDLPISTQLSLEESVALVARQGYQRLLVEGKVLRSEEAKERWKSSSPATLTVVQDRVAPKRENRARLIEACEQAYHFGKGKLTVFGFGAASSLLPPRRFSNRLHCADCDLEYRDPTSALFSFNHPAGACPKCRGFGRTISIDYDLAVPDRTLSLAQGLVRPWRTGFSAECQDDLLKFCRKRKVRTDLPFCQLPQAQQDWVINGDPGYGSDAAHQWPAAWYGVKGYFRWLESKTYKMHVRVLLSRYRAYETCSDCQGARFQPEALLYKMRVAAGGAPGRGGQVDAHISQASLTLADFYRLPIRDSLALVEALLARHPLGAKDPLGLVLTEVHSRLRYLAEVGLGYLTLDRTTRTLSGGETERVNLTTCLGTGLVNTLFVLDEPSVGLHPRDTKRLVGILERLRDAGNTVVVVEHETGIIRAADHIVDLGPGHGESGGQVVFQGTYADILKAKDSLTGQYLSGRKTIEVRERRTIKMEHSPHPAPPPNRIRQEQPVPCPVLTLRHATCHNIKDLTVKIPLRRFVCITGVSGSGKTTLAREILLPALEHRLKPVNLSPSLPGDETQSEDEVSSSGGSPRALVEGWEALGQVILVDQSSLGKTPRSNPAVYTGAFEEIRELFAQSKTARQRGLKASAFSFNSAQGQCERCRGAGFEKIEMQFLSDVFIRCPECGGRRYRPHILEVKVRSEFKVLSSKTSENSPSPIGWERAGVRVRGEGRGDGVPMSHRLMAPRRGNNVVAVPQVAVEWSIAGVLDATIDEVVAFLGGFRESRPAQRALASLRLLQEVGLGYLRLGQPINTLSGGESQRLKLVRHLAEFAASPPAVHASEHPCTAQTNRATHERPHPPGGHPLPLRGGEGQGEGGLYSSPPLQPKQRIKMSEPKATLHQAALPGLFLFDEPTTGLHADDVRMLLQVFQHLVEAGHSVVVIEHNLDVIKCADWIIDLGPDAGDQGGQIIVEGTPEKVAACEQSHTGQALRGVLKQHQNEELAPR